MKNLALCAATLAFGFSAGQAFAESPLIGIVSISATEANNARYITGAQAAAKELGFEVSVIDAAGKAASVEVFIE